MSRSLFAALKAAQEELNMKITDVKVIPVNEERLKAYVTITIEDCFVIRDLKIIEGNGGLFVAMPSKKKKDGTFRDIAHPLNQETRAQIEQVVFDAFKKEIEEIGKGGSSAGEDESDR